MNHGRRSLLGMVMLGAMEPLFAAMPPASGGAAASLDAELAAVVDDPAFPLASLSVLALRAGRPVYEGAFGRRTIGSGAAPDRPATPDTLYRIASISKLVTTLGLMRLLEGGKVDLDADVSGYLGFNLRNPHFASQAITLRHLLLHTSSLRDDGGYFWPATTALKDVQPAWSQLAGPDGAYYTYCNLGFGLIGTIMERVTGERFDRLMARLLLQPLGLQAGYNPSELPKAAQDRLATIYRKRAADSETWQPNGPWVAQVDAPDIQPPPGLAGYVPGTNATPFSPTGGLRISARDLGVVMRMLMAGGVHDGKRLLQAATVERMFARHWRYDGVGGNGNPLGSILSPRGLGNAHYPDRPGMWLTPGLDAVGHLGDAYGLRSIFAMDRTTGNGIVVLAGGSARDPGDQPGRDSSLARYEERVLASVYRRAILGQTA
ncbi:serine hydrolase domain-containing protein [Massilia oculi]|uniref:Serine hydrolase n=1 Tax=Massilia oculi TaxID=945844 RepID=A0A2S2DJD3_9BURK|nr:serine hydrolase domain-containing protein [Massilia oculi]AWL05457.1 serine hydrolase [Massilia oculi]